MGGASLYLYIHMCTLTVFRQMCVHLHVINALTVKLFLPLFNVGCMQCHLLCSVYILFFGNHKIEKYSWDLIVMHMYGC